MTVGSDPGDGLVFDPARRAGVALGRRRLLRGGLGAAPVLMTLASGSVSAGMCTTCSAHGSMHPSGKQASTACGGRSPTGWSNMQANGWPSTCQPTSKFEDFFKPTLTQQHVRLQKVIAPGGGYDVVACHCVAALLNASTSPPLTPATILSASLAKSIWASYATNGYFEPTAGVRWNSGQIVDWIKTTYS